jgi:hypothetical protein
VIARNTAFTFKGKVVDAKQLGRELGVRYVLEGSVRRMGEQVRVNVQLIDAGSGAHLWADRFDTDRTNLPEAQSEITGRLARTLNLELVKDAGRRIEDDDDKVADPDARDLVTRGWATPLPSGLSTYTIIGSTDFRARARNRSALDRGEDRHSTRLNWDGRRFIQQLCPTR